MDGIVITTPDIKPANFVLSCWLKGYESRGRKAHGLESKHGKTRYYQAHHPEFTRLLRSSTLALAAVEEDPDVFLGWALGNPEIGVLHYVFVKRAARGHGIADALVRAAAGPSPRIYTFEPGELRSGEVHQGLAAVAARRGMRFHPHPVPGIGMQREERA